MKRRSMTLTSFAGLTMGLTLILLEIYGKHMKTRCNQLDTAQNPPPSQLRMVEFKAKNRCQREPTIERSMQILAETNKTFSSDDHDKFLLAWVQRWPGFTSLLFRIQILDGSLYYYYVPGKGMSPPEAHETPMPRRLKWILQDLDSLMHQVALPDVDFFIWLGDGMVPLSMPMDAPDGSTSSITHGALDDRFAIMLLQETERGRKTIVAPPRSMMSCPDFGKKAAADNGILWENKINKAIFRGSTTGTLSEGQTWRDLSRAKVAMLSQQYPHFLDAGFTEVVQLKSEDEDEIRSLGLIKNKMRMEEQILYKMILNVDGNSLADRFPHQLVSNSVILKQDSVHMEYWYEELIPGVHYVPIANDLSDLIPTIESFLSGNQPRELKKIMDAGTEFVLRRLDSQNCWCYWTSLLEGISEYTGTVRLSNGHRKWARRLY